MRRGMKFEGTRPVKNPKEVIVIPKQDIEFSDPPPAKTEEAHIAWQKSMAEFIFEQGFGTDIGDPGERFLIVEEGLAIGVFRSLAEIHNYVQKGYPAADIERYKAHMVANGCPEDFHKLHPSLQRDWHQLPEKLRRDIRKMGADNDLFKIIGNMNDEFARMAEKWQNSGNKPISPNPKFLRPKRHEREGAVEAEHKIAMKHLKFFHDSGFELIPTGDGEVCVAVNPGCVMGPFPSVESAYEYLKAGHHLADIQQAKDSDESIIH